MAYARYIGDKAIEAERKTGERTLQIGDNGLMRRTSEITTNFYQQATSKSARVPTTSTWRDYSLGAFNLGAHAPYYSSNKAIEAKQQTGAKMLQIGDANECMRRRMKMTGRQTVSKLALTRRMFVPLDNSKEKVDRASKYSSTLVKASGVPKTEDSWDEAYPLCAWRPKEKDIWIDDDILKKIDALNSPLDVIAAVGPYRSGKSYLLSHLANKPGVFAVGDTEKPCTKGLMAYLKRHPKQPERFILFLDSEGLGDCNKPKAREDNQLFLVCILLSTLFIYNIQTKISRPEIEQLLISEECRRAVKVEGNNPPALLVLIRDFGLQLSVSPAEYLSQSLQAQTEDHSDEVDFFKERFCRIMRMPAEEIDNLDQRKLNDKFIEQLNDLREFVLDSWKTTKSAQTKNLTTKLFAFLLRRCVNDINKKLTPEVASAFEAFQEQKYEVLAKELIEEYAKFLEAIKIPIWLTDLENLNTQKQRSIQQRFDDETAVVGTEKREANWHKMLSSMQCKYEALLRNNEYAFLTELTEVYKKETSQLREKFTGNAYYSAKGIEAFQSDCENVRNAIKHSKYPQNVKDNLLQNRVEKEFELLASLISDVCKIQEEVNEKDEKRKQALQAEKDGKVSQHEKQLEEYSRKYNRKKAELEQPADLTENEMQMQKQMLENGVQSQQHTQESQKDRQRLNKVIADQKLLLQQQQDKMNKADKMAEEKEAKLRDKFKEMEEKLLKNQDELFQKISCTDREQAKELKKMNDQILQEMAEKERKYYYDIHKLRKRKLRCVIS